MRTSSYHEGDPADSRMTATARARGVTLTSRSRPLRPADLSEVRCGWGGHSCPLLAVPQPLLLLPCGLLSNPTLLTPTHPAV